MLSLYGGKKDKIMETKTVNEAQETVRKEKDLREGWSDAFAKYVQEGEDEMLLPDFVDCELE